MSDQISRMESSLPSISVISAEDTVSRSVSCKKKVSNSECTFQDTYHYETEL